MDITGAKAVVTGGASGLGEATARGLREAGAAVSILDRDEDRGQDIARDIGAHFHRVDVTDETSARAAIGGAAEDMAGISVCVNCAGVAIGQKTLGRDGPHPLDAFRRTVDINLVGSFNILRLAAEVMAGNAPDADGQRGVIVNTASVAAFDGQKGQAAYAASKAGIAGMSLPVARDLAAQGIRINAIAPGIFLTPMLQGLGQEIIDGLAADVTFPKRLGRPEEFARLVRFMIEADYLNGETIRLDGALRMR